MLIFTKLYTFILYQTLDQVEADQISRKCDDGRLIYMEYKWGPIVLGQGVYIYVYSRGHKFGNIRHFNHIVHNFMVHWLSYGEISLHV